MNTVQVIKMIVGLLFGLSFFLYGMDLMGDGLKKAAGNKLESLLYKLTDTPIKGILLGTVVTAVIQSSSATSVMVVGFVNAGMMKVAQGIGIIMGANIGTSITGWVLCLSDVQGSNGVASLLSSTMIASIFAIVGILIKKLSKKDYLGHIGNIMIGFAILMEGMGLMKSAMTPLSENAGFKSLLTKFSNPFLGILVGILITAILQSASVSVGILQSIAMTSFLPFSAALPIVMGIGVGAATPVLISGMSSTKNGKRTALVYLINDLFGMIIWASIFYATQAIVTKGGQFEFMNNEMNSVLIALMNTVYRVLCILVLAPFIKQIDKLVHWLVKDSAEEVEEMADFNLLEARFLAYPDLALAQSHTAMCGMADKASKNVYRAIHLFEEYDSTKQAKVLAKEDIIDKYEDKVGTYLMQLSGKQMSKNQTKMLTKFLHAVTDFERLSDHAVNIATTAMEMQEKKIEFSESATAELKIVAAAVIECVDTTTDAFVNDHVNNARNIEPLREVIETLCAELKARHVNRLTDGKCDLQTGFVFNDLITNYERIAAHCSNIAIAVLEMESNEVDPHEFLEHIREHDKNAYIHTLDTYSYKYALPTNEKIKKEDKEIKETKESKDSKTKDKESKNLKDKIKASKDKDSKSKDKKNKKK